MPNSIHEGGCACGAVRFQARGEPYRLGICHCLTCRKAHGAPFNLFAVFAAEAITVTGDTIEFVSSKHARRYSCRTCGSPVYSTYGRQDEFYLYPGSFDEIGLFRPSYELWTTTREPWLQEFPGVVSRYEESRPKWRRTEP